MKQSLTSAVILLLALFAAVPLPADDFIEAVTGDGKSVELYPDGRWKFSHEKSGNDIILHEPEGKGSKSDSAASYVEGRQGSYRVYYIDEKWIPTSIDNEAAEFSFRHKDGDGYAMIISEKIFVPLNNLEKIALQNAKSASEDARIVSRGSRIVNGHQVMTLSIEGIIEGIPFKYYGYYASGDWGTIQFITYTAAPIFVDYEKDFIELLDGLTIL